MGGRPLWVTFRKKKRKKGKKEIWQPNDALNQPHLRTCVSASRNATGVLILLKATQGWNDSDTLLEAACHKRPRRHRFPYLHVTAVRKRQFGRSVSDRGCHNVAHDVTAKATRGNMGFLFPLLGRVLLDSLCTRGCYLVCVGVGVYVMESFREHVAPAAAASRFLRSVFAFCFPICAPALYTSLGYGWGNTTIALSFLALGVLRPFVLWFWGAKLRKRGTAIE